MRCGEPYVCLFLSELDRAKDAGEHQPRETPANERNLVRIALLCRAASASAISGRVPMNSLTSCSPPDKSCGRCCRSIQLDTAILPTNAFPLLPVTRCCSALSACAIRDFSSSLDLAQAPPFPEDPVDYGARFNSRGGIAPGGTGVLCRCVARGSRRLRPFL